MRIIIMTGKGGVGKTSIAAATAVRTSRMGLKTLVMSTDAAHSLSDVFEQKIGSDPAALAENLDGQEVDARRELLSQWVHIRKFISNTMKARGIESAVAEELSVLPGMEELFSILLVKKYHEEGHYDVVIVDCAPTASTIRLLSFPEVLTWYLEKIFPIQRQVVRIARPVVKSLRSIDLPDDGVFEDIRNFILSLDGIKEILTDNNTTTVRFVLNLEKMVIREIQRAYTYMNLFGYTVDAVVINRVFPEAMDGSYLNNWKNLQKEYMTYVEEAFSPTRLLKATLFDKEILGIDRLNSFGEAIFGQENPAAIYSHTKPITIEESKGVYLLHWQLPGLTRDDIELLTRGEELIIHAPPFMRTMVMPSMLVGKEIAGARYHDGSLTVTFKEPVI